MIKKILVFLTSSLFLSSCPYDDASAYFPLNTIIVKRNGSTEKAVAQSQTQRFSTFYSTLETPSISINKKGNYILTWTDSKNGTRDVYARKFTIGGIAQGEAFQVNTTEAGDQNLPCVALSDNDEYIITWSGKSSSGNGYDVYARKYTSSGSSGNEFKVNTSVLGDQWISSVAINSRGSYVIVWQSSNQDGDGFGIVGQKFDNKGNFVGGEFLINSVTNGSQELSDIDMNANGEFVVVWKGNQNYSNTVDVNTRKFTDIYARKFDNKGNVIGNEITVSTTIGENNFPSVSINDSQSFSIVWNVKENNTSNYDIYARTIIGSNQNTQAFKVTGFNRPDALSKAVVGIDNNNNTTIVWGADINNRLTNGIFMKKFNSKNQEVAPEIKVNLNGSVLQPELFLEKKSADFSIVWKQY